LDHNLMSALTNLGWCKLYAGSIDQVNPLMEQAIRLSPRDPSIGYFYSLIGTVHLLQSHIDEAIVWFERVRSDIPAHPFVRSRLASAYALKATPNAPPPNSPKPEGWWAGIFLRASPNCRPIQAHGGGRRGPVLYLRPLISPAYARPECQRSERRLFQWTLWLGAPHFERP
jgi:hypothetical protein